MTDGKKYGTVVFDCDSTLSSLEGIEELAREHRTEIEAMTSAAMAGTVPLEEVYGRRLALVRPSRDRIRALGQRYIETLVPDARPTIDALKSEGIAVRIMSGGLKPAVLMVARALGVEASAVDAVDVYFDDDGAYSGFDAQSPLAASGGKRRVVESWGAEIRRPIMLVGDGATDQEAQPVVDAFVAFAGVAFRPAVVNCTDLVIRELSLAPVLAWALGFEGIHHPGL